MAANSMAAKSAVASVGQVTCFPTRAEFSPDLKRWENHTVGCGVLPVAPVRGGPGIGSSCYYSAAIITIITLPRVAQVVYTHRPPSWRRAGHQIYSGPGDLALIPHSHLLAMGRWHMPAPRRASRG